MAYYPYMTNLMSPIAQQNSLRLEKVPSVNEATKFPIQPNTVIYLLDENSPYLYMRSSDQNGNTSVRAFQITEVSMEKLEDNEKYLTKKDLEVFKNDLLTMILGANHNEPTAK